MLAVVSYRKIYEEWSPVGESNGILFESNKTLVMRCSPTKNNKKINEIYQFDEANPKTYILKLSKSVVMTNKTDGTERDYDITLFLQERMPTDGIIRVFDHFTVDNAPVVVKEDNVGAVDFCEYLNATPTKKLSLEEWLVVSIKLCNILGQVHKSRVLHLDIKPQNILYNPKNGILKLFDFSISCITSVMAPYIRSDKPLGSYQYMAPEQTARVQASIDTRSDIYTLGGTLYYLITGEPAFKDTTHVALIHAHFTKTPPLVSTSDNDIPSFVDHVIQKMMAKNKEDRYQAIKTVENELTNALKLLQCGKIDEFCPIQTNISDIFQLPSKLYGRDRYLTYLTERLELCKSQNIPQLIFLAGEPGIGKTAIYSEFCNTVGSSALFVQGKYDQFNNSIPYSAILNCMQGIIGHLIGNSIDIKEPLLEALEGKGRVLLEVLPDIQMLMGENHPHLPNVGADETLERFLSAMIQFFRVVVNHCLEQFVLIMMIDDIQWADISSFKLLEKLATSNLRLIIINIYRDNEVGADHPLHYTLSAIQHAKTQGDTQIFIDTLQVKPLTLKDLNELLTGTVYRVDEQVDTLAEIILSRSNGNPFFARQLILNLYRDELIWFEYDRERWEFDLEKIKFVKFADNVVNMMIETLNSACSEQMKHTLKTAACIGNYFSFGDLMDGTGLNSTKLRLRLREAVKDGWLLELNDHSFKFNHDKLQESAYKLMDHDNRMQVHHHLGRSMLDKQQKIAVALLTAAGLNCDDAITETSDIIIQQSPLSIRNNASTDSTSSFISATEEKTSSDIKVDSDPILDKDPTIVLLDSQELIEDNKPISIDTESLNVKDIAQNVHDDDKPEQKEKDTLAVVATDNKSTPSDGIEVTLIKEDVEEKKSEKGPLPVVEAISNQPSSLSPSSSTLPDASSPSEDVRPREPLPNTTSNTPVEQKKPDIVESTLPLLQVPSKSDTKSPTKDSSDTILDLSKIHRSNSDLRASSSSDIRSSSNSDVKTSAELTISLAQQRNQILSAAGILQIPTPRGTLFINKEKIFDIVMHFNRAIDRLLAASSHIVKDSEGEETVAKGYEIKGYDIEIDNLVVLNLQAVKLALLSSASAKAVEMTEFNSRLVKSFQEEWSPEEYDLLYQVYLYQGEALRVARLHEPADNVLRQLMERTQKREHKYEVMFNRLNIYNAQTRYDEGYDMLIAFLDQSKDLIYSLPHRGTEAEIMEWITVNRPPITELMHQFLSTWQDLPQNENLVQVNFLRCILESIAIFYLSGKANKTLFIAMLLVGGRIQLTGGLSEVHTCLLGPLSFAHHILTGNADLSYRLADSAREIAKRYTIERWTCISNYFFAFNCHARKTLYEHHELHERSLHLAIRCGEHCWGSLSCAFVCMISVEIGQPVDFSLGLMDIMMAYSESLKSDKVTMMLLFCIELFKFAKGDLPAFSPLNSGNLKLTEEDINAIPMIRYWYWGCKSLCDYYSGNDEAAFIAIEKAGEYLSDIVGCSTDYTHMYRRGIVIARLLQSLQDQKTEPKVCERYNQLFALFEASREHLIYLNTKFNVYVLAQYQTIEAEYLRLTGKDSAVVMKMYFQSIEKAQALKSPLVAAIAATRLANYVLTLQLSDRMIALQACDAIRIWTKMGYKRIQNQLTEEYHRYITGFDFNQTGGSSTPANTSGSAQISALDTVDSHSFSMASQVSNFENQMDITSLFSNMLSIIQTSAGASRCCLIVQDSTTVIDDSGVSPSVGLSKTLSSVPSFSTNYIFETELTASNEEYRVVRQALMESGDDLCLNVIQRVLRSRNSVLVDDATTSPQYKNERYIQSKQVSSILCMPIVNHLRLEGCVYLENAKTKAAFTDQRCLLLRTIIDVSIENARLFTSLNNSYARFLPAPFLQLLGKPKVTDVQQGDAVERKMSVMFSDIRNFTSITEKMSAKQSFQFVNNLFQSLTPQIELRSGFVDKYIGDAIMALFPHKVSTALHAALGMKVSLKRFNRTYDGDAPISIGIGIHFGSLMLGTVGTKQRLNATVISDTVNIASRLEGLTKAFGCPIIVSQDVITEFELEMQEEMKQQQPTPTRFTQSHIQLPVEAKQTIPTAIVTPIDTAIPTATVTPTKPPSTAENGNSNIRNSAPNIESPISEGSTIPRGRFRSNPDTKTKDFRASVRRRKPPATTAAAEITKRSKLQTTTPEISIPKESDTLAPPEPNRARIARFSSPDIKPISSLHADKNRKIKYAKIGSFLLKGKDVPYNLYEVYMLPDDPQAVIAQEAERAAFAKGLELFYSGDFMATHEYFVGMQQTYPHHLLAAFYAQVCALYATRPRPKYLAVKLDKDGGYV